MRAANQRAIAKPGKLGKPRKYTVDMLSQAAAHELINSPLSDEEAIAQWHERIARTVNAVSGTKMTAAECREMGLRV